MFSRTERVLGIENLEKLKNKKLIVFGLGGVGGYVAEMLVRMGINKLTVVDFDRVDISNINRQILALKTNLNKNKTDEFIKRAKEINEGCIVKGFCEKLSKENIEKFYLKDFDYVIDAIDDVKAKVALAKYCFENNIKIISSMGTGNRFKGVPQFEVCDISKTSYDALSKKMRKLLKDEGVKSLTVVYTKQLPEKAEKLGSVVYYPLMCAGTIVSFVVNELIK